jgi:hypothetical protein
MEEAEPITRMHFAHITPEREVAVGPQILPEPQSEKEWRSAAEGPVIEQYDAFVSNFIGFRRSYLERSKWNIVIKDPEDSKNKRNLRMFSIEQQLPAEDDRLSEYRRITDTVEHHLGRTGLLILVSKPGDKLW